MNRFLMLLLISTLFFASCFVGVNGVQAQSKDTYSLQLQGFVWNHTTLDALVVTADNMSWWNPDYLNTSLRAIGQWNDAITAFAANNTNFSYLSNLQIQPIVSTQTLPGYDIYLNWTESPLSNTTDEVGLSQIYSNFANTITNCTISLAAHTNHGESLSQADMQNIALHELGHSLGLGHSNYTGDLMYSVYNIGSSAESVSTLDAYGVATLFAWELNTTLFYPTSSWLNVSYVSLPSDSTYQGLPVSPQNAVPATLANNSVVEFLVLMFEILIHPEVLAIVAFFVIVLVVIILIPKGKKQNDKVKVDS